MFCWGSDQSGQLGDRDGDDTQAAPLEVAGGATNWVQITADVFHSCGIKKRPALSGQLGHGTASVPTQAPAEVLAHP